MLAASSIVFWMRAKPVILSQLFIPLLHTPNLASSTLNGRFFRSSSKKYESPDKDPGARRITKEMTPKPPDGLPLPHEAVALCLRLDLWHGSSWRV